MIYDPETKMLKNLMDIQRESGFLYFEDTNSLVYVKFKNGNDTNPKYKILYLENGKDQDISKKVYDEITQYQINKYGI